jgi:hypothetical protein
VDERDDRKIAFHEAGHVVVAWAHGLVVESSSIDALDDGPQGRTRIERVAAISHQNEDQVEKATRGHVMAWLAGSESVALEYGPEVGDEGTTSDERRALDAALVESAGLYPEALAYVEWLRYRVRRLLATNADWQAEIAAVARSLLAHRTLDAHQLSDAMNEGYDDHMRYRNDTA